MNSQTVRAGLSGPGYINIRMACERAEQRLPAPASLWIEGAEHDAAPELNSVWLAGAPEARVLGLSVSDLAWAVQRHWEATAGGAMAEAMKSGALPVWARPPSSDEYGRLDPYLVAEPGWMNFHNTLKTGVACLADPLDPLADTTIFVLEADLERWLDTAGPAGRAAGEQTEPRPAWWPLPGEAISKWCVRPEVEAEAAGRTAIANGERGHIAAVDRAISDMWCSVRGRQQLGTIGASRRYHRQSRQSPT